MKRSLLAVPTLASLAGLSLTGGLVAAQTSDPPDSITTPDSTETRIGTLEYWDGVPSVETAEKARAALDFTPL